MEVFKIVALGISISVFVVVIKQVKPELAVAVLIAGSIVMILTITKYFSDVFEMFDFPSQNFAQQGNGSPGNPTEIWGRSTHSSVNACSRAATSLKPLWTPPRSIRTSSFVFSQCLACI